MYVYGLLALVLIIWLLVIQNKIGDIESSIRSIDKENRMRLKNIKTELKNLEEKLKSAHFDNTPPEPQIQTSKEFLADKEEDAVDFDEIIPDSVKSEKPNIHYEYATQINTPTEKEQEQEKIIIREQDFQPSERVKIREQNFQQKEEFDFENAFLGNIFNKIGAIVLIIGIGFFISIISKYIIFTPFMKICFAFILGLGMICGANQMKESEKLKAYSEVLMGTGFSVLFLTVFYASAVFKMFNSLTTAIIAGIILICTYFEAERQKTNSMVVIALLGGYLTSYLFFTEFSTNFIFGYFIFLNLVSLVFAYRNPDKSIINFVNLAATSLILLRQNSLNHDLNNIIYPLCLWFIYLFYDLVRAKDTIIFNDKNNILNWLNLSILTIFSIIIFKDGRIFIGSLLAAVGIVYDVLIYCLIKTKSNEFKPYVYSLLAIILLATYFLTEGILRTALWSLETAILCFVFNKYKLDYLLNFVLSFFAVSVTSLFFIPNTVYTVDIKEYYPIINTRLYAFLCPCLTAGISYWILKNDKNSINISNIFKFCLISLIYMYIIFELNDFITSTTLSQKVSAGFIKCMLFTIIGFIYTLQIYRAYTYIKMELFRCASLFIGVIALCVLIIAGYNYQPAENFVPLINIRFLAYSLAIVTSIVFARWTNSEIFKYIATILGFILIHIEVKDYILNYYSNELGYLISVVWILYAGAIITAGIFNNKKFLKNCGIWISILAILKICILDLAGVEAMYKLIAFCTLGFILMTVSYFYNKYNINKF